MAVRYTSFAGKSFDLNQRYLPGSLNFFVNRKVFVNLLTNIKFIEKLKIVCWLLLCLLMLGCGSGTESDSSVEQGGDNQLVVAVDDVVPTRANESVHINVLANDALESSGGISILDVSTSSQNAGAISLASSWVAGAWTDTITYSPPQNYTGSDQFSYTITNGQNNNSSATVTVNINNGFGGDGVLPKPIIAPGGGTYFSQMQVSIFSIVMDAQVWYSLDGATDIANMQLLEEDFIVVDSSRTITAIATKDGFESSEIASANFAILVPGPAPGTGFPGSGDTGSPGSGAGGGGASSFELRVNAGGNAYDDAFGNSWMPDQGFNSGQAIVSNAAIGATNDPMLYQTARTTVIADNTLDYSFDVDNGGYFIKLHFAETDENITGEGQRVFDVLVEENVAIDNFDIYQRSGNNFATTIQTYTWVNDNSIDISLVPEVGSPVISAIEILNNGGFGGPGNIPPIAILLVSPASGVAPLEVELDASNSEDPEGNELTYSWDLDEDGVFGDAQGSIVQHVYNEPGIFTPQVEVSDGELSTRTFTKVVIPDTSGGNGDTSPPPGGGSAEPIDIEPIVNPENNATLVDANTLITAVLSNVADIEQIYWAGINVMQGPNVVTGMTTFDNTNFNIEFTPDLPLTPGATFTVNLNASLGFADGSWSMAYFMWEFSTAP